MKSKQINFLMTKDEMTRFFAFLAEEKWFIAPYYDEKGEFLPIAQPEKGVCFLFRNEKDLVKAKIDEKNTFYIDVFKSAVIEVMIPYQDNTAKTIRRGRMYVVLENKEKDFIDAVAKVFRKYKAMFANATNEKKFIITQGAIQQNFTLIKN